MRRCDLDRHNALQMRNICQVTLGESIYRNAARVHSHCNHVVTFNVCKNTRKPVRTMYFRSWQIAYFCKKYKQVCKLHNNRVPEKSGFALHIKHEKHHENVSTTKLSIAT